MPQFVRRILIVEDDSLIGSLMVGALSNEGFIAHLSETAVLAKRQLATFDPDVVLVDIDLGDGPSGIDFVQVVRKTRPEVAAILLSKHADSKSAGLRDVDIPEGVAYLRKSLVHDTSALIAAINDVTRGGAHDVRQDMHSKGELDLLTNTQREILYLMARGYSNKEIARLRGVSLSSVEQRVSEIFKAFRIAQDDTIVPRVEAVRRYIALSGLPER